MTTTIISSATKEVRIGFDQPFVVIGEALAMILPRLLGQAQ